MKRSRYTDERIDPELCQAEMSTPVKHIIRKMGIAEQTFSTGKSSTGAWGPASSGASQIEEENRHLKQTVADRSLDRHMLQEVL